MWFKVDDGFWANKKVEALEQLPPSRHAKALALWLLAGSWCGRFETDGCVTETQLRKLVSWSPKQASRDLCNVGLWDRHESSLPSVLNANGSSLVRVWFEFRSWLEFNPSRNELEMNRKRSKEWRENKGKTSESYAYANDSRTRNEHVTKSAPYPSPYPYPYPIPEEINDDDDVKEIEEPSTVATGEHTRRRAAAIEAIKVTWARNYEQAHAMPINTSVFHRDAKHLASVASVVVDTVDAHGGDIDAVRRCAEDIVNGYWLDRKKPPSSMDWLVGKEAEMAVIGDRFRNRGKK